MRRLALDCSGDLRSAALMVGDTVACAVEETGARVHAERLVPLLEGLMARAGWPWSSLDELIVATGPGSFTGIRLAVAATRGLALALDRPVRSVRTLEALLAQGAEHGADVAVIDARRGGVYASSPKAVALDGTAQPQALAAAALPADFVAVGSGAAILTAAAGRGRPLPLAVHAAGVARAALAGSSPATPGTAVHPFYGRAADAVPSAA